MKRRSSKQWEWFGQAGHFCAASKCRFHLHTHVNGFCISTVGEYFPSGATLMHPMGAIRSHFYETMVFKIEADGDTSGSDIEGKRYAGREEARHGHMRFCRKYERKQYARAR